MRKLAFWDVQNFIQGIRIELEGFLPVLCQFFTYVLESHLDSGCTKGASGNDLIMVHSLHCHDLDCLIMLDLMLESTKLAIREIMSFVESWKCFGYKRMCTCVGRLDSVRQASSNALPIQLCREERIIWQIFRFQCFDWHSPFSR